MNRMGLEYERVPNKLEEGNIAGLGFTLRTSLDDRRFTAKDLTSGRDFVGAGFSLLQLH